MAVAIILGEDPVFLAGEALLASIEVAQRELLGDDVKGTLEAVSTALALYIGMRSVPEADPEELGEKITKTLTRAIAKVIHADRLTGPFSAEAVAAMKNLALGIPCNASMAALLKRYAMLDKDGKPNPELITALEAAHAAEAAKETA